jgi:hypothetical protein
MTKKVSDAVVISVSKPDTYEGILSMSGEELLTKVRNGEIVVPKTESREDFIKFAGMDETARGDFIKGIKPVSGEETVPPDTSGTLPEVPGEKPPEKPETGIPESGKPPGSPKSPEEAHQELLMQVGVLTSEVNKHRGNAGKLGKELKNTNTALEEARTTITELQKTKEPAPKDAPAMPEMPNPENFVEGYMDPEYKEAQMKHHKDMKQFYKNIAEYQNSTKPEWARHLSEQIDETTQIAKDAKATADVSAKGTAQTESEKAWNNMWGDAKKLQPLLNLPTSVDINVINDNQIIKNNMYAKDSENNPFYTQDVINAAVTFLNNVSEGDYANYAKVTKIINNLYTVDTETGIPSRNFQEKPEPDAIQAAIALAGLQGDVKALQLTNPSNADLADRLSQKQAANSNLSSGMPASQVGASDPNLGSEMTTTEKQEKLLEMNKQIRNNQKLLKDNKFMESFNKLRTDLGVARK